MAKFTKGQIVEVAINWFGTLPGTRLRVIEEMGEGFYEPGCYQVCREDGKPLPSPRGSDRSAVIHENFLKPIN
jgi:hypothetical protein